MVPEYTDIDDSCREAYEQMCSRGWNLAAEVLTAGHISLTIEDRAEGRDIDIRVIGNGPGVQAAIEEMLKKQFPATV